MAHPSQVSFSELAPASAQGAETGRQVSLRRLNHLRHWSGEYPHLREAAAEFARR